MSPRIAIEAMWLVPRLRRNARAAIQRAAQDRAGLEAGDATR
jgi:hypothetical protein